MGGEKNIKLIRGNPADWMTGAKSCHTATIQAVHLAHEPRTFI
jgi:hypothetical protein